jgi:hypothetical protein
VNTTKPIKLNERVQTCKRIPTDSWDYCLLAVVLRLGGAVNKIRQEFGIPNYDAVDKAMRSPFNSDL